MSKIISLPERITSLRQWYCRPLGRLLADVELSALAEQLPNLFGYHLMVIDPPWEECVLTDSRIPHHVIQRVHCDGDQPAGVIGNTDAWPVLTDTVDAIVLAHTLEMSGAPHQVLREAERSLIPDGHLVILGFNPRSMWGMRRFLSRDPHMPWGARFLSMSRVKDWLSLLGFDTLQSRFLFHRPPVQNTRILDKLGVFDTKKEAGWMLMAGAYILVARKRTVIMTPLKAGSAARRRLFPVGVPSSSQRNIRRVR